jgi:hypothetical protein
MYVWIFADSKQVANVKNKTGSSLDKTNAGQFLTIFSLLVIHYNTLAPGILSPAQLHYT